MSQGTKKMTKALKQVKKKIPPPPFLRTHIKAGEAVAAPPLGPSLGARNIQIGPFCKQFNEHTKDYKPGIPLPTVITLNPDRSVTIQTNKPPVSYYLRQAAGCRKGAIESHEVAGIVTLKHVYEIAKIKSADSSNRGKTLEEVCQSVIGTAHSIGIKVERSLDPKEYQEFLRNREVKLAEHEQKLEEIRQSKMLRL